jgi:hypothetical protein
LFFFFVGLCCHKNYSVKIKKTAQAKKLASAIQKLGEL